MQMLVSKIGKWGC